MKDKYQIFARKYRPQFFKDIAGQEAIITTLKNSLRLNKTAQAYLFSGSRGTGKTSLTRLFAKALNCQNLKDFEPCNHCRSCLEITNSSSLDVIEIDGASNRGIDDIRQINETIGYAPSSGKYKIYIIDEVHMLTKEAFNALLKTLEEPPSTVKFFFATTEPHKVLPTIISRCQRFDLKRISPNLIIEKLKIISEDQQRTITEEALHLIARFADGSLRDAESMLDQILCYSQEEINTEIIDQILGLIPQDHFFKLDLAAHKGEIGIAFELTAMLYNTGKDFTYFVEELIEHYRKILMLKIKSSIDLSLSPSLHQKYLEVSSFYSLDQCLYIIDYLLSSLQQMQKSPSKQYFLEMILLQIIKSKSRVTIATLVQRLSSLEKNFLTSSQSPKNSSTLHENEPGEKITFDNKILDNKPLEETLAAKKTSDTHPLNEKLSFEKPSFEQPTIEQPVAKQPKAQQTQSISSILTNEEQTIADKPSLKNDHSSISRPSLELEKKELATFEKSELSEKNKLKDSQQLLKNSFYSFSQNENMILEETLSGEESWIETPSTEQPSVDETPIEQPSLEQPPVGQLPDKKPMEAENIFSEERISLKTLQEKVNSFEKKAGSQTTEKEKSFVNSPETKTLPPSSLQKSNSSEKTAFQKEEPLSNPTPPQELKQNKTSLKHIQSQHDTLLNFTAIELNGILRKE